MPLPGHPATMGLVARIRDELSKIEAASSKDGAGVADADKAINACCDIATPLARLVQHLGNGKDSLDAD